MYRSNAKMSDLRLVHTDHAPAAIGPYSQAIVVDGWVFCSGQIPLDPATGELVGDTIDEQTDQALRNLAEVLDEAGSSLQHVVKTTVFLADMNDFARMNKVYEEHFGEHRPARAAIQAAALPRFCNVEIECIARLST
jgi:2-iminobutanoate/2-iminopropanoate deaminase